MVDFNVYHSNDLFSLLLAFLSNKILLLGTAVYGDMEYSKTLASGVSFGLSCFPIEKAMSDATGVLLFCFASQAGCLFTDTPGQHSPKIGYAFDGIAVYGPLSDNGVKPTDLDICNGRTHKTLGYIYHITGKAAPYMIGCYSYQVCNVTGIILVQCYAGDMVMALGK